MEVIVRNLHDQITEKQLESFFRQILDKLGIKTFNCQKLRSKGVATVTILDLGKARQFLKIHGQTQPGHKGFTSVQKKLYRLDRPIFCSKSNNDPDDFLLLTLKKEESDRYAASQSRKPKIVPGKENEPPMPRENKRGFDTSSMKCGQWTYVGSDLAFMTYFQDRRKGRMVFGYRSILVKLTFERSDEAHAFELPSQQVEIPYNSVQSFTVGPKSNPCITFLLAEAPKVFESLNTKSADSNGINLEAALQNLDLRRQSQTFTRKRITAINQAHEIVVAGCLCYRFRLSSSADVEAVQALKCFPEIPNSISWNTSAITRVSFAGQSTSLNAALTGTKYARMPFELKFQMQKLAQNGYLGPAKVVELLAVVSRHLEKHKATTVVDSVRSLFGQIPFPGPETEASDLSIETLSDLLIENQESILRSYSYSSRLEEQYDHIASVHKATVTPAGVYLYGPEPETKNRVLRKYSDFPTHFLSVSFLDEHGEPLRFDRQTSGADIYHERFKTVLESVINIAGRPYEFLGFSHSSLRAQTSWFMAPFILNGNLIYARSVIKDLGDFSLIRSPAKCAARIGQAFSQTFSSVSIPQDAFFTMKDIIRNGRTFSDGVGTCSPAVLQKIWEKYSQARGLKPTVLQIRFQGAKGVISLDTRLQGSALYLRPSMIKFGGTNVADIEICGAALKPLPMYLNRQLIKILEDLHVPAEAFLRLQADAVENLRMTTLSSINAASFLERNFIGKAGRIPWLIRKLYAIGLSFSNDNFLRNVLELAVLIQLRELKHRSRIRVDKGWTLYGIMDETGFLRESEVYVSVQIESEVRLLTGNIVITRSPALHPGDVQCVTAVDVPFNSPLRALHNVVVFSSKGERDLPSQLSGGDLDGDLYNVIFDVNLYPKRLSRPADYDTLPPVDIQRPVEKSDMTNFFVEFMENDNLGLIATLHQIIADQKELGTFDPTCILLANMHSTAVDFSKTGRPVDFKTMPKYPKFRPDFQAPGPRVLIEKEVKFEEDQPVTPIENDELEEVATYGPPKVRYYESRKVLGKLYRKIDEHQFFEQIQEQSRAASLGAKSLVDRVWKYIEERVALIQWRHYLDFARDVKESYEDNLVNTMQSYSAHPAHFVSEIEVFSGSILGKNGAQSKRQREFSVDMKEKHERDVAYTVLCITQGEGDKSGKEALERSVACLYTASTTMRVRKKVGALVSFSWIAAAICLKEVERLPGPGVLL